MRIEKINEKQIRCTLNQKELKEREIGISELAYGTSKAKALFRDMMQQASYELGFDADDIPLMIEAIPLLPEALVLVITKVEDPDELDTRFSCFTEEGDWDDEDDYYYDEFSSYENDMMAYQPQDDTLDEDEIWEFSADDSSNLLDTPREFSHEEPDFISLPEVLGMEPRPKSAPEKKIQDIVMIFSFPKLETVTQLSYHIHSIYHGQNTLYKDSASGTYYLILHRSNHEPEEFSKVCNILYEYGTLMKNSGSSQYYYEEHFQPVIKNNAVEILAGL
jgi:adapter protein MecA 1/2